MQCHCPGGRVYDADGDEPVVRVGRLDLDTDGTPVPQLRGDESAGELEQHHIAVSRRRRRVRLPGGECACEVGWATGHVEPGGPLSARGLTLTRASTPPGTRCCSGLA